MDLRKIETPDHLEITDILEKCRQTITKKVKMTAKLC